MAVLCGKCNHSVSMTDDFCVNCGSAFDQSMFKITSADLFSDNGVASVRVLIDSAPNGPESFYAIFRLVNFDQSNFSLRYVRSLSVDRTNDDVVDFTLGGSLTPMVEAFMSRNKTHYAHDLREVCSA